MTGASKWSSNFAASSVDSMQVYEDVLVPRMFNPWAELLLDELAVVPGERLVDIACGPGTVTRFAAQRVGPSGTVTGCDLSPAMLAIARAKPAQAGSVEINYLEASADQVPLPDSSADVVTCQQGLQFFPDRISALREFTRVVRPGGRIGVAVWGPVETCPPFAALGNGIADVFGADAADTYRNGPWGFGDVAQIRAVFDGAGLGGAAVETRTLPVVFEGGPAQLVESLYAASVGELVRGLDEAGHAELVARVATHAGDITRDGAVTSYLTSQVAIAVR